jgi:hypothetical protein
MHANESSSTHTPRLGRRCVGLIAINAVLLGVLALVSLAPNVSAQVARSRGDYLMVGGRVNGADGAAVFVIDNNNQEMIAVSLNNTSKKLDGVGYRNLAQDAAQRGGRRN